MFYARFICIGLFGIIFCSTQSLLLWSISEERNRSWRSVAHDRGNCDVWSRSGMVWISVFVAIDKHVWYLTLNILD